MSLDGSKAVNVLVGWRDCVWAVCGSACEVWCILRHEAGESSKGGTLQGTVNPSKKFPLYPQVS